jgi:hypothetical protein
VGGDLDLENTKITYLPESLEVGLRIWVDAFTPIKCSERFMKKLKRCTSSLSSVNAHSKTSTTDLPAIKWSYPTDKEILNELQSEYAIETLFIFATWPKQQDYAQAVIDLKEVSRPQVLDPKNLKGKHIWNTYEDLYKTVKSFGLPKDPDAMLKAIRENKPLPMPIVVKRKNGEMELLGGATRSGIANLARQNINALMIDEKKANLKMADAIEKKVEIESRKENKKQIYDQIRNYYLNNKPKPVFEDPQDIILAHIAEHKYRKIAKLRGYPEKDWVSH